MQSPSLSLWWESLPTPLGEIRLAWDLERRLRILDWAENADRLQRLRAGHYRQWSQRERQAGESSPAAAPIQAYFAGDLNALAGIEWAVAGTAFQRDCWHRLSTIAAGHTSTYQQLAAQLGKPQAARAVGAANAANPISLVIPCHRLIGRDGDLTGYAGGLARKRWLLAHEAANTR